VAVAKQEIQLTKVAPEQMSLQWTEAPEAAALTLTQADRETESQDKETTVQMEPET
jgi:hypothetical protein